MTQPEGIGSPIDRPVAPNQSPEGFGPRRHGKMGFHDVILIRHVVLPPHPDQREALPHQKSVAEVLLQFRIA